MNESQSSYPIERAELERIDGYSEQELDSLPFGAIRLDRDGNILSFNQAEVNLSGRKRENVLGKSFFREVAPCTDVQEFGGRFREGVAKGALHITFPYVFDYQMDPRKVWVTLFYSKATDSAWVFVRDDRKLGKGE